MLTRERDLENLQKSGACPANKTDNLRPRSKAACQFCQPVKLDHSRKVWQAVHGLHKKLATARFALA